MTISANRIITGELYVITYLIIHTIDGREFDDFRGAISSSFGTEDSR